MTSIGAHSSVGKEVDIEEEANGYSYIARSAIGPAPHAVTKNSEVEQ